MIFTCNNIIIDMNLLSSGCFSFVMLSIISACPKVSNAHPHPPCCGANGTQPPPGQPSCPRGPCTPCRTPGSDACCPCLKAYPPEPPCISPELCANMSSARGDGIGLGMYDAMVFAGGAKGNIGIDAIDILNTTTMVWTHAKMSVGRTLFSGAALGRTAIFACGEGDASVGGTADIFDVFTLAVKTVTLKGGPRKKCAAVAVTLSVNVANEPLSGKIIVGGGYKSTAVDVFDYKTKTWSVTQMSISHFYMAATSAGPYALFCGGLAPSGDTSICDTFNAQTGRWTVEHLAAPAREIAATSVTNRDGAGLAVFCGGGHTSIFNAESGMWTYRNATIGQTPWGKEGAASINDRFAIFGGGNGNFNRMLIYDGHSAKWLPARRNLSFGREQVMGAATPKFVGMAGGSIGNYQPTGYTRRVDLFPINSILPSFFQRESGYDI